MVTQPDSSGSDSLVELLQGLANQLTSARSLGELFHEAFRILSSHISCDLAAAAVLEQNLHLFISRRDDLELDDYWFGDVIRERMASHLPFAPTEAIIAADHGGLEGEWSGDKPQHDLSAALSINNQIIGIVILARGGTPFGPGERHCLEAAAPFLSLSVLALRNRDQVQQLADTDHLTGSWNKRSFRRQLNAEVDRARVYKLPLSLLMLDVDDFKDVNDEHGHLMGDVLLSELCGAVRESLRPTDFFARFGGDEFAILMPHTDAAGARAAAERILEHTAKVSVPSEDGSLIHSTISIGIATYDLSSEAQELLKRADENLYEAKRQGKNRIAS